MDGFGAAVARRARRVLLVAGVGLVLLVVGGVGVFARLSAGGFDDPASDSSVARSYVDRSFGGSGTLVFLVRARSGTVDSPAVAASGTMIADRLSADRRVNGTASYWPGRAETLRSRDGREALIVTHVAGDERERAPVSASVLADYGGLSDEHVAVTVGGAEGTDIGGQVGRDLGLAEAIAVPLVLMLLLLAFGSIVAAVLPVVVAAVAVSGTFAALHALTAVTDVSVFAINLATALGLGLGVDYCLLIVARFREELAGGAATADAVARTVATAGRTVLFSASAVSGALAAMLVFPAYLLRSFAYAGVAVTLLSALAAVVVLPAALALLGHRVDAGSLPFLRRASGRRTSPLWRRIATLAMDRPVLAIPALLLLVVLAVPALGAQFKTPDARSLPAADPAHVVVDAVAERFTTQPTTVDVILVASSIPRGAAAFSSALSRVDGVQLALSPSGVYRDGARIAPPEVARQGRDLVADGAARIELTTALEPTSTAAQDMVRAVRELQAPPGIRVLVGGSTAALLDSRAAIAAALPLAAAIIAVVTLALLFLFTGSLVQPVRALLGNLLTTAATLGVAVWVFQSGNLSGLLGFVPQPLDTAMPVLLFCIVFGLSMDYELFLIGRIKEVHDSGTDVRTSTIEGLARTGRVVSTAAGILAVSFFAFLSAKLIFLQLLGLGAGIAILLDATVVRAILLPASMRLLGRASWWAPRPLRVVHDRFGLRDA